MQSDCALKVCQLSSNGMNADIILILHWWMEKVNLNVEVDGRQHKILPSQRAKDIVRDYRLKANGWSILRIEVADIIANTSNCIERVKNIWNNLKEGDSI